MSIALAATWNPRGEEERFKRLLPQIAAVYSTVCVVLTPHAETRLIDQLGEPVRFYRSPEWPGVRRLSLEKAIASDPDFIHYADLDRLLRWVETRPQEWWNAVTDLQSTDYLVFGRTAAAYASHPRSLVETEAISNRLTSYLVGQKMDVSAGSKGFSRQAADFILKNSAPMRAIGTDAEWTVLLHRGGFRLDYSEVDGLDWETADRYRDRAANSTEQEKAAQEYDADPAHWQQRVAIAMEIVESGLDAAVRQLTEAG